MLHILLSVLLVGLALMISIRRHGAQRGYLVLSWVPSALLVIASGYELQFGFKRFAEVLYHLPMIPATFCLSSGSCCY